MGDMGDYFNDLRECKRQKKDDRGVRNRKLLSDCGLRHESMDMGDTHYHVWLADGSTVSFWPTSGAWRNHGKGAKTRYGFADMMRYAKTKESGSK